MGLYLNPGNEEFRNAAIHSKIYVDKTEMIKFTNSQLFGEHKNICVSRPRRFGKSMAANMLVAYYSKGCDSKELFENFKIADDSSFKEHLNKYNVIHLNIQQFLGRTETIHEMLELLSRKVTRELKREFADVTYYEEDLVSVIEEIYAQTHSFFVFIIDDSMFERNRSKKAELLAKVYDHAKHKYLFGFRMLTLGWSDGSSFLPVNSILLSTENRKNRINEATEVDKRTVGYKRRKLSLEKGTQAMLTLLDAAKKAAMTAHTAVVFTRYMILSLESRESNDNRSLGELFLYFSDEMSDIT